MKTTVKICVVLGTRPEAIKLAPLILHARQQEGVNIIVCNTGQHREMTDEVLDLFGIVPDFDLEIMRDGQTLEDVGVAILSKLPHWLSKHRPDWLIVQGDTTTSFFSALAAFYQRIKVAHVEAGLRTGNSYSPWPEEMNRRLVSKLVNLHFAPTGSAAENLKKEGLSEKEIMVTGNTGIDALKMLVNRLENNTILHNELLSLHGFANPKRELVLVTGHRRENFGEGLDQICQAVKNLAKRHSDVDFAYPVHPNPSVQERVYFNLGSGSHENIHLLKPLAYLPFIALMSRACLIMTDSGGIQEEAPSLGKRVLVLRETTERTEGLQTGLVRLVGTDQHLIEKVCDSALSGEWSATQTPKDVYGDGRASERILNRLLFHDTSA